MFGLKEKNSFDLAPNLLQLSSASKEFSYAMPGRLSSSHGYCTAKDCNVNKKPPRMLGWPFAFHLLLRVCVLHDCTYILPKQLTDGNLYDDHDN